MGNDTVEAFLPNFMVRLYGPFVSACRLLLDTNTNKLGVPIR